MAAGSRGGSDERGGGDVLQRRAAPYRVRESHLGRLEGLANLYRSMSKHEGLPLCCANSGWCLGVRIGPDQFDDLDVQDDGLVHPQTGGMSVAHDNPRHLPTHRRPPRLGGTSNRPLWMDPHDQLPVELEYAPDPPDSQDELVKHGVVGP